jgi:hypothetical protein
MELIHCIDLDQNDIDKPDGFHPPIVTGCT